MKVTVGIPSILRKTLENTLRCLSKQSYKNFDIILVYKGELRESVKRFNRKLKISFIEQKEGFLEEAYNEILKISDSDLLLFTDDDACPSPTWVEDHVQFHDKNPKVGVAGGIVHGKIWKNYPNYAYELFKGSELMEEADEAFKEYVGYLTKTGLSVDRGMHKNNEKTLAVAGVNMSVKKPAYEGFQAYTYSIFASYIETQISLNALKRGYDSVRFPKAYVYHKKLFSLSVPTKQNERKLIIEKYSFPYIADKFYKLDQNLLQLLAIKMTGYPQLGLCAALRGLKETVRPNEFRKILLETYNSVS